MKNNNVEKKKNLTGILHNTNAVFGIIGTVIVILGFLGISQIGTDDKNTAEETSIGERKKDAITPRSGDTNEPKSQPAESIVRVMALNAEGLSFQADRDIAYKSIIEKAIDLHAAELAIEFVERLAFSADRDEANKQLIDALIKEEKFETATGLVGSLSFSLDRDEARKKIIESRQSRH